MSYEGWPVSFPLPLEHLDLLTTGPTTGSNTPSVYNISRANELLPDPDGPVIIVNESFGISMEIFLRLCSRAPTTLSNYFS